MNFTKEKMDIITTPWKHVVEVNFQVAILPWGATEPHNLHLRYGTDSILSHAIACEAACRVNHSGVKCMVLPVVPLGSQNPGQTDMSFCIHARYDTQRAVLTDIVASLYRQGMRRLVIVNGHGGNNFRNMVRDLAVDYPDFIIAVTDWWTIEKPESYFSEAGDHAGELETSVMMHFHPEWVLPLDEAGNGESKQYTMDALKSGKAWLPRNWAKVSYDTGIGNPKGASAEKGKEFTAAVVESLAQFLADFAVTEVDDMYENTVMKG